MEPQNIDTLLKEVPRPTSFARYPNVILVLDFIKSNPQRKIQLVTSNMSPLALVLMFHSSETYHYAY